MSDNEQKLVIKHLKSPLYRDIEPDGFLASQASDANGYYIKLLAVRNDVEVLSETLHGEWNGENVVQFDEDVEIDQRPVRIQELALKLTPRMAVNLHTAISRELDALPDDVAIQYGIQKVETDK